jgi:hypothetical protein
MKTATISVRVPIDFKTEIQSMCNTKGVTMSDFVIAKLTPNNQIAPINAKVLQSFENGGQTTINNELPLELSKILGVTGGTVVGVIVYNALKENLTKNNPDWDEDKVQVISFISGFASALLSGYGLHKLTQVLGINGDK